MNQLSGIVGGFALLLLTIILFQGNTIENSTDYRSESSLTTGLIQTQFIGEIRMFGGNYAPKGWAFCEGQLIKVSDNMALFSIVGTFYGGDGRTTFALPDLRGKVPVHPNNKNIKQGSKVGNEFLIFTTYKMESKQSRVGADFLMNNDKYSNYQPSLGINFIIALEGEFPLRN